jgi:GT2 family glycosyltransferase
MNLARREKIVLLGFLSHFPVAGVAWQTMHYLVGLQRLGCEVYYVEAHGCTPSKLMRSPTDDGPARAAEYIKGLMRRFGLERRWAYHALYESRCLGMSDTQLRDLLRSASFLINLHGSHLPRPELTETNRLVYLGTDPVDIEIDLHQKKQEALDYLTPHCAFFTYGENLGRPDCRVPVPEPFRFHPTRQPVVMEFWENHGVGQGNVFTTIGNWRQPWRQVHFQGEVYQWSKHFEFQKFLDLPRRVAQPFELALSSCDPQDQRLLESHGWRVRPALDVSQDLDDYRRYIGASRGEFTVAKDQNVRLRSGWFSDRAITYLAAGRPVITQETGFSNILPTGEGLFAYSSMEEIVAAVETVNADYDRHRRAAWRIARDCFSHEVVLTRLLRDLGISPPAVAPLSQAKRPAFPPDLVIVPTSRWPTRLPQETMQAAAALPLPAVEFGPSRPQYEAEPRPQRASVVIVTYNGLLYTRLCLASLFSRGWPPGDELIVVDNGSTDGTPAFLGELQRSNPFVRLVRNERNLGFAAANNQGLAQASGEVLILLNNDTLTPAGWRDGLARWLRDPTIGLVGPVTNRTCNEAQIDAPYRTFGEMEQFAEGYAQQHRGQGNDLRMLAMFCVGLRREVYEAVGPLDEQYQVGMFEDDDYALRVRRAGYRIVCAEDVFIHHFGQASLGELCLTGEYDSVLETNRRRFEAKWGLAWRPHERRLSPEYQELRQRIRQTVARHLPAGATVIVISKGDDELLRLGDCRGWHFPQGQGGAYANSYPADGAEAISRLEALRLQGAGYLLIPKPALWWLEHYGAFKDHLQQRYPLAGGDRETCLIFDLRGHHAG